MHKLVNILIAILYIIITASQAYAANTADVDLSGVRYLWGALSVVFALVYFTRKRPIGGFLFYYYFNLYGGLLLLILFSGNLIENLNPNEWENMALYSLYTISLAPPIILQLIYTVLATRLLYKSQRNLKNVNKLRYLLAIFFVACLIAFAIDYVNFPEDIFLSTYGLIVATIWMLYFFFSYRVKYVLANWSGTWDYESFKNRTMPSH